MTFVNIILLNFVTITRVNILLSNPIGKINNTIHTYYIHNDNLITF